MKHLNLFSILFTLILLFLVPNLAAAMLVAETAEIPYQINNSDRIMIGTVSKITDYGRYTITTITVNEWLYNPLPAKTIQVRTESGSSFWTEDEAEFTTHNESVLLMLKDKDLNKQLFSVTFGFPGKHPISDRDAVVKELKAQGKWPEENQTENKTNETEIVENTKTENKQEDQNVDSINDTKTAENTETTDEKEESSNKTQKPKATPFMSPVSVIAVMLGTVIYLKRKR
ncbi:hypothetical protein ASJ81_12190 [Methanosarcina spelaei]|uniref:S-layer family duplication domain-containing protein n=1 Tax=Methanosarcina spelaei TaxID=1036679 RepID=A0A2A2HNW5_9EURY|nr:hypothetical protein [Methanosarcina spelaei]PAV10966.1 hypothetical protein ASJ81_12190 [Methanosarcina spelaei]